MPFSRRLQEQISQCNNKGSCRQSLLGLSLSDEYTHPYPDLAFGQSPGRQRRLALHFRATSRHLLGRWWRWGGGKKKEKGERENGKVKVGKERKKEMTSNVQRIEKKHEEVNSAGGSSLILKNKVSKKKNPRSFTHSFLSFRS
jgi:hypothetical protein